MTKSIKKVILLIAALASVLFLSACGNRQVGIDTSQTFNRAIIKVGDKHIECNVKYWRDFDGGDEIQITTPSGTVYLTHYTNVVLIKDVK